MLLRKLNVFSLCCFLFLCGSVTAAEKTDYTLYEKVLQAYVNDQGRVDYEGLLENREMLDQFIKTQIQEANIASLSKTEQKAFWINAYNALTLRLIADHYPPAFGQIRSINWGRPWDVKMRAAGRDLTLNSIEHDILRKWEPADPRIHFAINCASIGCPQLPNTYFAPDTLDDQLEREARKFHRNPDKVRLDKNKNILYHSAIYSWFEEDFLSVKENLLEYIAQYVTVEDRSYLLTNEDGIKLKALKYDWGLNKQE